MNDALTSLLHCLIGEKKEIFWAFMYMILCVGKILSIYALVPLRKSVPLFVLQHVIELHVIYELQCDILIFLMNVAHIICVTHVEWHQTLASGSSLRARLVLGCLITQNALYCIRPQGERGCFKRFVFLLWHKYECCFLHWPVKRFAWDCAQTNLTALKYWWLFYHVAY